LRTWSVEGYHTTPPEDPAASEGSLRVTTVKPLARDAYALLASAVVAAVAAVFFGHVAPGADAALTEFLNLDESSWVDRVLKVVDVLGPRVLQAALVLAVLAVFLLPRALSGRHAAVASLVGFAWAQAVTNVFKATVRRDRPLERPDLVSLLREIVRVPDVERSFPSGHVTTATSVAAGLWLLCGALGLGGKKRHLLAAIPLVMMWDRVAEGLHHPSDACAGAASAALSVGLAALGAALLVRHDARRAESAPPATATRRTLKPALAAAAAFAVAAAFVTASGGVKAVDPVPNGTAAPEFVGAFDADPPWHRFLAEPFTGPPLAAARIDRLPAFALWSAAATAALALVALALRLKLGHGPAGVALFLVCTMPAAWIAQFTSGAIVPDRFKSGGRAGVFVDWHLHGGDRADGRHTVSRTAARQRSRGVDWAVTTQHTSRPEHDSPLAHGVFGTEWSGKDYPQDGTTRRRTAHVLVLGSKEAVDAANLAAHELDAVRAGKANGALVIVAHYWRTAARDRVPSLDEFLAAGVDGFEVGNRYDDSSEKLRAGAAEVDAFCRRHGLLRLSFSDDHGVPAGSPYVTWIDGVTKEDLEDGGAEKVLSRLRRDAPEAERISAERVVPLRFVGTRPSIPSAVAWLAWLAGFLWLGRRRL
jgi:membrane-associated phospholipid phosphatase